jgi:plastocyanin
MISSRRIAPLIALCLIVVGAAVPGCSKKSTNLGGGSAAKELESPVLSNGGVYMHTFANAGTYNYHCTVHGLGMAGTVTVANGQAAATAVSIQNNLYNPASVSVAPTGTVTWTNNGGNPHTVTSN